MSDYPVSAAVSTRVSTRTMFRRRVIATICSTSLFLQTACYNSIPVAGDTTVPRGDITIEINDRGRQLVGAKLGSLVDHVEGRIVRANANEVEVAVNAAVSARGDRANWGGEHFTIPREGIGAMRERKLNKRSSWLLAGAIFVGAVAILAGIVKNAFASGDPSGGSEPPPI